MKRLSLLSKCCTLISIVVAPACYGMGDYNWEKLNKEAFEYSMIPVALPQRDGMPYWNMHAKQFMMPPAFDIAEVPGAASYLFTLQASQNKTTIEMESDSPKTPLTAIWDKVPVGNIKLTVKALNAEKEVIEEIFCRNFYRCSWFKGPYPAISHDYKGAAIKALENMYNLPHVQAWLNGGSVDDKVYRKYCYPSKTLSAIINGLLLYSELADLPEVSEKSLIISRKMADWLIENSCPAGTPLEFLPPTYWKHATYELATPHIGQIMMIYPSEVGTAYLHVYKHSRDKKYLDAAVRIAETMKKLERPDGSWYLKHNEQDGKPTVENVVLINHYMIAFFHELSIVTGDSSYKEMSDRAYKRLIDHNLKLWNWDGQFEDVVPKEMYQNLTKHQAVCVAADFFRSGDIKTAEMLVAWVEDQFVVWDEPAPGVDLENTPSWRSCAEVVTPMVLEQYNCYWPVNASLAAVIDMWLTAYHYTGKELYLAKAMTLADSLLRNQRPDGSIPTWFFTTNLPDWLNCTVRTAKTLLNISNTVK